MAIEYNEPRPDVVVTLRVEFWPTVGGGEPIVAYFTEEEYDQFLRDNADRLLPLYSR